MKLLKELLLHFLVAGGLLFAGHSSIHRGGLGAGSSLMWDVEGVVGCNITRNIFSELGYGAISFDYENDGLTFDTITHGPQITTGIRF